MNRNTTVVATAAAAAAAQRRPSRYCRILFIAVVTVICLMLYFI